MIKPWLQDEAFLADVADARKDWEQFHLWWVGQSGFLLQWRGRHLLFDPYLSDSLTKKYANTDKPHARMTGRVVAPERLKVIDVVTSSHNHTDHLDPETLVPLLRGNSNLELIIPEANREFVVDRLQVPAELPRGLDAGQFTTVAGFKIHAVKTDPLGPQEMEGRAKAARAELVEFLKGCDLLILDTQYTDEEYKSHIGWGHGWLSATIKLAVDAGVKKLVLFHHDPTHDDDEMDAKN